MAASTRDIDVRSAIASGLLSFPLTDFDESGQFDAGAYAKRLEWLNEYGATVLFAAGGAGEFFSLTREEYTQVVGASVAASRSTPVIAATGYGTRMAIDYAQEAERLRANALLLLPPYLIEASQEGLSAHIQAVCHSTRLGVIIYNRANCRLEAETLAQLADICPNLIGFKDGIGNIEEILKVRALIGDRLACINGMPTAEIFAQSYYGMGIRSYSSAIYNFVPRSATAFYRAVLAQDHAFVLQFNRDFLIPYGRLRRLQPGYAVSIVKAGAAIVGHGAGKVRPPLSEVTAQEYRKLGELIERLGPQG